MILKRFISDAFIKKLHSSHLIIELWTVLTRFPGPSKGTGVPLPVNARLRNEKPAVDVDGAIGS